MHDPLSLPIITAMGKREKSLQKELTHTAPCIPCNMERIGKTGEPGWGMKILPFCYGDVPAQGEKRILHEAFQTHPISYGRMSR